MAVKVVRAKKERKKETVIFSILCVVIILLLAVNIWALVYILNGTAQKGSPSIVSENQSIVGYTMYGEEETTQYLTLDNEILNPGSKSNRKIRIKNLGGQDVYMRLSCDFKLLIDDEYQKKDFLNLIVTDDEDWIISEVDGKCYYLKKLVAKEFVDINIQLEIKPELSQDDLYEDYRNCLYKVFVNVETIDANGVTLVQTPQEIHSAWN